MKSSSLNNIQQKEMKIFSVCLVNHNFANINFASAKNYETIKKSTKDNYYFI